MSSLTFTARPACRAGYHLRSEAVEVFSPWQHQLVCNTVRVMGSVLSRCGLSAVHCLLVWRGQRTDRLVLASGEEEKDVGPVCFWSCT